MLRVKRHQLVVADFQSAYDWYETIQHGLGADFIDDFRLAYQRLRYSPLLYSVRFANVRRLNLQRFPYGIFYVVMPDEIRVLALLHASRDSENILVARRRTFKQA
jgi:plasmid stabilization system protein ParE